MNRSAVLAVTGLLLVGACGGGGDEASDAGSASESRTAASTQDAAESIEILTEMTIAAKEGAEPIATGEVLDGSNMGASPFCVGGSILDTHAEGDPDVEPYGLIDRTITCGDGTVRMAFTPGEPQGAWTIVSANGVYEGWDGAGELEVIYDPDDEAIGRETLTGTVTR